MCPLMFNTKENVYIVQDLSHIRSTGESLIGSRPPANHRAPATSAEDFVVKIIGPGYTPGSSRIRKILVVLNALTFEGLFQQVALERVLSKSLSKCC